MSRPRFEFLVSLLVLICTLLWPADLPATPAGGAQDSTEPFMYSPCDPQHLAWIRVEDTGNGLFDLRWPELFHRPCTAVLDRVGPDVLVSTTETVLDSFGVQGLQVFHLGTAPQAPPPYIRWADIGPRLEQLQYQYPDRTRLHVLGHSINGLPVFALEISDAPGQAAEKPVIRLTGAHHGNETVSTDIIMGLAEHLVSPAAADLRRTWSFWLIPVLNPDGYLRRDRYNANGEDLNRDYGMYTSGRTPPYSQPETLTQLHFGRNFPPLLSLDYHSEARYVNTVYDGTSSPPPGISRILELAEIYAGPAELTVIIGYNWYPAYGSCQDAFHGTLGSLAYTIETLQPSDTSPIVARNILALDALLAHMEDNMICGRVMDSEGRPVRARVHLSAHPQPVFTSLTGFFCHIPDSEPMEWVINAPRFETRVSTMSLATIPDPLEFRLEPSTGPFGAFQIVAAGNMGTSASNNPVFHALGLPDGLFWVFGREGYIVLDTGLPLVDGPGAELSVIFDPSRQSSRVQARVGSSPIGPFVDCGTYSGDFDLDLGVCGVNGARFIRLQNQTVSGQPAASLDGLVIAHEAIPLWVDEDGDGVPAYEDCDDQNPDVGPGFPELCDGLDNNCNGLVDEGFVVTATGDVSCETLDASVDIPDTEPDGSTNGPGHRDGVSCACNQVGTSGSPISPPWLLFMITLVFIIHRSRLSAA